MSQIHNDLCIKSIDELRQVFKQVQIPNKQPQQQQQSQQQSPQKEVERIIETTAPTSQHQQLHCHPICFPSHICHPINYQPFVIVQEQPIIERKSNKKKKKYVKEVQEEIQVQIPVKKSRQKIEQPNFNVQREVDLLEQLIRQVKIQEQPAQVLEYHISVPEQEKPKDNTEMIAMLSALKQEPIQLPKDDYLKIENARLQEEIKNTKIQYHELSVKYEELQKRKRKEKIVKEIEYKEIPKIIEVPRDVIKEVVKPFEVIKEVIKEVEKPSQMNTKEIPIYIPQYKEVTVNKEVPVYKEVQVEKEVKVYKDIPVYKDVPVYYDVPVYRDVPIYQKVPVYKEVPVYSEPINVYREIPIIKQTERIPETIVEYPNLSRTRRVISPSQNGRSYIRSPQSRIEY
ncbi:unnamed protein product [Paramecium pentaurelia]|uniref:Uncharacterized protein n=1 Tax=Paramecium pentaurelia TaxID=43138 RepID=A0A8S1WAR5_9CILI|nr:unnamed protein product [Paramecium pentaurelia]